MVGYGEVITYSRNCGSVEGGCLIFTCGSLLRSFVSRRVREERVSGRVKNAPQEGQRRQVLCLWLTQRER